MTAEVIIINRDAIALAADSAVTFQSGKIFNSANKLYMLAPKHKIGILVFNNSTLMSVSWELIIKLYRDDLVERDVFFDRAEKYVIDFIEFIESNNERLFPKDFQKMLFQILIERLMKNDIFKYVNQEVQRKILETTSAIEGHTILEIARQKIDEICTLWEQSNDLFSQDKILKISTSLKENYDDVFDAMYDKYMKGLNLNDTDKARLWNMCVFWFTKERWFNDLFSGIAIAGYGTEDLYPSYFHYNFESYICGSLKYSRQQSGSAEQIAGVIPLAQSDIMELIIQGMHEQAWKGIESSFLKQTTNLFKDLYNTLVDPDSKRETEEIVEQNAQMFAKSEFDKLKQGVQEYMYKNYTKSIINIVQSIPKDELALMAETLVNTTSYMRRVSSSLETVGGPTDVAVISKKDGFVWIKRKHYFEPKYNYHFFNY